MVRRRFLPALLVALMVVPAAQAAQRPGAPPPKLPDAKGEAGEHRGGDEREEGREIRERYELFHEMRAFPNGIPRGARSRAVARARTLPRGGPQPRAGSTLTTPDGGPFAAPGAASPAFQWAQIGPKPIADLRGDSLSDPWTGRVSVIAPDPSDSDTIYVGGASGGVWKTTNAGASWKPLSDDLESLAMGGLAVQPGGTGVVLAGTGEPNFSLDSYYGAGIFRSVDRGATWTKATTSHSIQGCHVSDLIFKPGAPSIVYAGVLNMGDAPGCANPGLYRSANGGSSFTRVAALNVTDLDVHPGAPNSWFAAVYNDGIYPFTDAASPTIGTRMTIANTGPVAHQRIALAIAPSDRNRMYAAFVGSNGTFTNVGTGLFTSGDGGTTWTEFDESTNYYSPSVFPFPWYALALQVDRSDPTMLYVGSGPYLVRFLGAGTDFDFPTFRNGAGPDRTHADFHSLVYAGTRLWMGTDGGVYSSDNPSADTADTDLDNPAIVNRNANLALAQFEYGASASTGGALAGGTQDNGSLKVGTVLDWPQVAGCDGGWGNIHATNPQDIITTPQSGCAGRYVLRTTNGGLTAPVAADSGINGGETGLFYAPLVAAPNDPNRLWYGRSHLWTTANRGTSWVAYDSAKTFGSRISAIGASGSTNTVYVGTELGQVSTAIGGGASWVDRTLPGYVTDIAVDPASDAIAYASVSGFGHEHLFKTTDTGGTWTQITSTLGVDSPANAVAVDWRPGKGQIYLATDVGTFVSGDGGATWADATPGMPRAVAMDVLVDTSMDRLVVFTHGRGAWAAALGTSPPDTSIAGGPAAATTQTTAGFTLAASPAAGATFQCKLDDGVFETCPAAPSYSGLAEGEHTFQARAISAGGSDQTPALRTWTIDLTPPNTTITSAPPTATDKAVAAFAFSSNEPGSTFACSLDGGLFGPCAASQSFTVAAGAHALEVRATDPAGNVDPSPAAAAWTFTPAQQPQPSVTPTPTAAPGLVATLSAARRLSARKLRKRQTVKVGCTRTCAVRVTVKRGKLTLAKGRKSLPSGGTAKVGLKPTKKGRRKLKRTRKGKLVVRAVFTDAAGAKQTLTRRARLKP